VKVYNSKDSSFLYNLSSIYLAAHPGQFSIEIPKEDEENAKDGEENN
jgi:hypothetical protein